MTFCFFPETGLNILGDLSPKLNSLKRQPLFSRKKYMGCLKMTFAVNIFLIYPRQYTLAVQVLYFMRKIRKLSICHPLNLSIDW